MEKKIGRNDPCPCGSGQKYKNCCFGKKEEKKTYTSLGKRKFSAKVIKMDANSQALYSGQMPTSAIPFEALRYPQAKEDYSGSKEGGEELPLDLEAVKKEEGAKPTEATKEPFPEEFKPTDEDYTK